MIIYINRYLCLFILFLPGPKIRLDSSEYSVAAGEAVTVRATVGGYPPAVTWMFDGKDVSSDQDINITTECEDRYTITTKMTITKAALRHSGTYTIKAVNGYGTASKDIRVTVCGKYNILT